MADIPPAKSPYLCRLQRFLLRFFFFLFFSFLRSSNELAQHVIIISISSIFSLDWKMLRKRVTTAARFHFCPSFPNTRWFHEVVGIIREDRHVLLTVTNCETLFRPEKEKEAEWGREREREKKRRRIRYKEENEPLGERIRTEPSSYLCGSFLFKHAESKG